MTFSNSKLTKKQNRQHRSMRADIESCFGSIATVGSVTVIIVPEFTGSSMARMSVSFAAPEELKLRRKVGEYHALSRYYNNQSVPVPAWYEAETIAQIFADTEAW